MYLNLYKLTCNLFMFIVYEKIGSSKINCWREGIFFFFLIGVIKIRKIFKKKKKKDFNEF